MTNERQCKICRLRRYECKFITYTVCEDCAAEETEKIFPMNVPHVAAFVKSIPGEYPATGLAKLQELVAEAMQRGVVIEYEPGIVKR